MSGARLRLGKSAADHLFVPLKAVLDQRWWEAAEVAGEETRIEDDPLSLQVDQVPRESSRRNSLGLAGGTERNFDTSRTYALRVAGATSVETRFRSRPVHCGVHAPMVERCLGCSLGCSTDLQTRRDRRGVRPPRDRIRRDWLCDEEPERPFTHLAKVGLP